MFGFYIVLIWTFEDDQKLQQNTKPGLRGSAGKICIDQNADNVFVKREFLDWKFSGAKNYLRFLICIRIDHMPLQLLKREPLLGNSICDTLSTRITGSNFNGQLRMESWRNARIWGSWSEPGGLGSNLWVGEHDPLFYQTQRLQGKIQAQDLIWRVKNKPMVNP